MNLKNKRIIINKINQIGDVTFSLPLASVIKKAEPSCYVIFLGREYSRALINSYADVDEFADWGAMSKDGMDSAIKALQSLKADVIIHITSPSRHYKDSYRAAQRAGIPIRIGTIRQIGSLLTCNRFVNFSRHSSQLHETQLDMKFLGAIGLKNSYSLDDIIALRKYKTIFNNAGCLKFLDKNKFNLILHPKTRGQHIEWLPDKFAGLIQLLPVDRFNIFITGSELEGEVVRDVMVKPFPHVVDLTGKTSLDDLIQLIAHADGLISASTGPVHLAANFGIHTLGLYSPKKPQYAFRWGPVGVKAEVLTAKQMCAWCQRSGDTYCECLEGISAEAVLEVILKWDEAKHNAAKIA